MLSNVIQETNSLNWTAINAISFICLTVMLVILAFLQWWSPRQEHRQTVKTSLFDKRFHVFETIKNVEIFIARDDAIIDSLLTNGNEGNLSRDFVYYNNELLRVCSLSKFLFNDQIFDNLVVLTDEFDRLKKAFYKFNLEFLTQFNNLSPNDQYLYRLLTTTNASDFGMLKQNADIKLPQLKEAYSEWEKSIELFHNKYRELRLLDDIAPFLDLKKMHE